MTTWHTCLALGMSVWLNKSPMDGNVSPGRRRGGREVDLLSWLGSWDKIKNRKGRRQLSDESELALRGTILGAHSLTVSHAPGLRSRAALQGCRAGC